MRLLFLVRPFLCVWMFIFTIFKVANLDYLFVIAMILILLLLPLRVGLPVADSAMASGLSNELMG